MHLRAIKLRGFKSFPEPVEVRLEQGVAVVVGPNGSGKSNVADAIVWAAGSMAPSELRAEKPDDVIFAGGGGRSPEDFCEVELLFDNPAGEGPVPYTELSVARRLHRGGEGQYLLNRHRRPAHRPRRAARRPRPRRRNALDHRPGPRRGDPRLEA
jgi:chromosome segregation protein